MSGTDTSAVHRETAAGGVRSSGTARVLRSELTSRLYELGWAGAKAVPGPVAYRLAQFAADRVVLRNGPAVKQYKQNLQRVLGADTSQELLMSTVQSGLRSYARYWIETFRLPVMNRQETVDTVVAATRGLQHVSSALESERGVVVVSPHSGNWDVAAMMIASKFGTLTSVAEHLKPDRLYRKFVKFRSSLGVDILPLTGGPRPASAVLRERLNNGGVVCLLGDRDLTSNGVGVSFFGQRARMPAGPAMLAALTGADLLVAHSHYTYSNGILGWAVEISPPVELPGASVSEQARRGTQTVADRFTEGIRAHPEDWHMLQPLWSADRS